MLIVVESSDSYPVSFYLYSALHLIILLYLLYFIQFSRCNLVLFSTFYVEMTRLVGLSGLEPPTSRLSGGRSNQLSYKPIFSGLVISFLLKPLVEISGIEPLTPCLQSRCSPS